MIINMTPEDLCKALEFYMNEKMLQAPHTVKEVDLKDELKVTLEEKPPPEKGKVMGTLGGVK